jgi:hypothetical protein
MNFIRAHYMMDIRIFRISIRRRRIRKKNYSKNNLNITKVKIME